MVTVQMCGGNANRFVILHVYDLTRCCDSRPREEFVMCPVCSTFALTQESMAVYHHARQYSQRSHHFVPQLLEGRGRVS